MNKPLLTTGQWKCLLVLIFLYATSLNIWSTFYWERSAMPGVAGILPVSVSSPDRNYHRPILTLAPGSTLALAGAKPGDTLVFDRAGDVERYVAVGEPIGVTWYAKDQPHHVTLTTIPDPSVIEAPLQSQVLSVITTLCNFLQLLLALLIGLRRSDDRAMRIFATMLILIVSHPETGLPGGAFQSFLTQTITPFMICAVYVLFTYFTLIFPAEQPHWRLVWVRRLFKAYVMLFALIALAQVVENYGALPAALREYLQPRLAKQIISTASVLLALTALWLSWRQAIAANRQRLAWVGVCMGSTYATFLFFNINMLLGQPFSATLAFFTYYAGVQTVALVALGYALLRYRLFDFGFVVNRALVVTIISGLLLVAFAVSEFTVDKLLHFEGREKNVIFDAGVALAIILSFHRIQHWVNHQVNHTFFHHWYETAERLRQFLAKTVQITESKALQSKYVLELSEFSGASGVAIYLDRQDSSMELCHGTLANAPAIIDANNDTLIELRHSRRVIHLDQPAYDLSGELALPMMTNGRLRGLVLMGAKLNQQQYRPDELGLLATAAQQLGMDLESLHAAQLEGTVDALEARLTTAQQQSSVLEQTCLALERETALLRQLVPGASAAVSTGLPHGDWQNAR